MENTNSFNEFRTFIVISPCLYILGSKDDGKTKFTAIYSQTDQRRNDCAKALLTLIVGLQLQAGQKSFANAGDVQVTCTASCKYFSVKYDIWLENQFANLCNCTNTQKFAYSKQIEICASRLRSLNLVDLYACCFYMQQMLYDCVSILQLQTNDLDFGMKHNSCPLVQVKKAA